MTYTAWVSTPGPTDESTMVNGSTAKWKEREYLHGLMGASTWASTKTIKSMAREHLLGQMAAVTMVNGKTENSTEKVFT